MRRGLSSLTIGVATVLVAATFVLRPVPLPGAPPPVRLEGQYQPPGTTTSELEVVPSPWVPLEDHFDDPSFSISESAESPDSPDSPDSPESLDSPSSPDSFDSPDD